MRLHRHFTVGDTVVRAVDGIDLSVQEGEMVSVMGPSGCGKSTLLHLLGGLDRPTSGEIHLGDVRVDGLKEAAWARLRRRRIGFVFQDYNLIDDLTARDNLELPAVLAGSSATQARARADSLLDQLGIGAKAGVAPAHLSGGERQRVAIGRALVNHPDILLADEPTGALDSRATSEVLQILGGLHRAGQAIVVVTHDPRVATVADRLLTMRDGQVVDETPLGGATSGSLALGDLLEH
ncbi:MAG: ABC transporter ATP-binding protein [Acidimicrobiales bacterium]